jgi:hypothetical protein
VISERLRVSLLAIVCLLPAGCTPEDITKGIYAENRTTVDLHFAVTGIHGEIQNISGIAKPGETKALVTEFGPDSAVASGDCTVGDAIAYGPDGVEIARHHAPLCVSEGWVIGPGSNTSVSP